VSEQLSYCVGEVVDVNTARQGLPQIWAASVVHAVEQFGEQNNIKFSPVNLTSRECELAFLVADISESQMPVSSKPGDAVIRVVLDKDLAGSDQIVEIIKEQLLENVNVESTMEVLLATESGVSATSSGISLQGGGVLFASLFPLMVVAIALFGGSWGLKRTLKKRLSRWGR
jgi:hypothetical protein